MQVRPGGVAGSGGGGEGTHELLRRRFSGVTLLRMLLLFADADAVVTAVVRALAQSLGASQAEKVHFDGCFAGWEERIAPVVGFDLGERTGKRSGVGIR